MQEINLYDLIKFYARKWRFIAILTVAGLAGGFVYNTFIQVPEYKSSAKLLLVSSQNTQTTTSQTLLNNYIDLIQSRRVLEPVVAKQNNSISYEQLTKAVSAVNQKDTAIIDVKVTTTNAKQSADIANEITDSFKEAVTTLYQTSGVIVVDPGVEPTTASNVSKLMQLGVATLSGFLLSVVIGFFAFDYLRSHPLAEKVKKPASKVKTKKQTKRARSTVTAKKISSTSRISELLKRKTKPVFRKTVTKKPVTKQTTTAKINIKKPITIRSTAKKPLVSATKR